MSPASRPTSSARRSPVPRAKEASSASLHGCCEWARIDGLRSAAYAGLHQRCKRFDLLRRVVMTVPATPQAVLECKIRATGWRREVERNERKSVGPVVAPRGL